MLNILETERLLLRNYQIEDLDSYNILKTEPLIWKYSTTSISDGLEESKRYLDKVLHNYDENLPDFQALFIKDTNEYIGEAGVLSYVKRTHRAVIGYNLLPEYWNKGYATEITKAIVKHLFEVVDIERIEALVMQGNDASRRVLEKSGFIVEGILRHFTKIYNDYYDVYYYGMIKSDYFSN